MLRDVFQQFLSGSLSRREFLNTLTQLGVGAVVAGQLADVFAATPKSERQVELSDVTGICICRCIISISYTRTSSTPNKFIVSYIH